MGRKGVNINTVSEVRQDFSTFLLAFKYFLPPRDEIVNVAGADDGRGQRAAHTDRRRAEGHRHGLTPYRSTVAARRVVRRQDPRLTQPGPRSPSREPRRRDEQQQPDGQEPRGQHRRRLPQECGDSETGREQARRDRSASEVGVLSPAPFGDRQVNQFGSREQDGQQTEAVE